jgi:hypothetical protein
MLTLLLLFAFQVVTPGEMACVGSIQESRLPEDVYIAGLDQEGAMTMATPNQILYLNGPGVSNLKIGAVHRVVRPEGSVRDPLTLFKIGTYYRDIGTIKIEAVGKGSAAARVTLSCQGMVKGDVVIPSTPRSAISFSGRNSDAITSIPSGLSSTILLGKDDMRELVAGHFCFIQLGTRHGVKPGDRFTIYRQHPSFDPKDMDTVGTGANATFSSIRSGFLHHSLNSALKERTLPPKVLGDLVIVEAGEGISTGKIINSLSEVHTGDLVIKR